jgi:DNA-binding XRE family transcriptional regulator/mannose-6-phosphate isomerase-like protein (cupin superfamily)
MVVHTLRAYHPVTGHREVAVRGRREQASSAEYGGMGDRLRAARQARGLSLRALAERLNVSPSLISQVETGRANPSVSTLYAIVQALGISLDELLFTDAWAASAAGSAVGPIGSPTNGVTDVELPENPVQRADARSVIRLASGVTWERLTTASIPNVDFLYVTYEVGGASSPEDQFQRHSGQEWGFVLAGRLGVRIGFDEHVLGPGDAIAFDSATPHRLFNAGTEPVHGVWFVLGRRPAQLGSAPARAEAPVHSH